MGLTMSHVQSHYAVKMIVAFISLKNAIFMVQLLNSVSMCCTLIRFYCIRLYQTLAYLLTTNVNGTTHYLILGKITVLTPMDSSAAMSLWEGGLGFLVKTQQWPTKMDSHCSLNVIAYHLCSPGINYHGLSGVYRYALINQRRQYSCRWESSVQQEDGWGEFTTRNITIASSILVQPQARRHGLRIGKAIQIRRDQEGTYQECYFKQKAVRST
jgi:hypothetical protein